MDYTSWIIPTYIGTEYICLSLPYLLNAYEMEMLS